MTLTAERANEPAFLSRIVDLDSHEMIPSEFWTQEFGECGTLLKGLDAGILASAGDNTLMRDDITADDAPITYETVRNRKGPSAPGAIDFGRRPEVLSAMGVDRQLAFPTFGLTGMMFVYNSRSPEIFGFDPNEMDRFAVGREMIRAHNDWCARVVRGVDAQRVRPVALLPTDSLEQMMRDAEAGLDAGISAFWIPGSTPPAGTSPGDKALDPFWRLMAESNATVTYHLGTEFGFLADTRWTSGVPQFANASAETVEFNVEPYRCSVIHLMCDNFLSTLILGGVFERHPNLRFGVIECAAHWAGPLADSLDLWYSQFRRRLDGPLSMKPSEYFARNIRVTPFHFEPVDEYIERYPHLQDVYSYSSDYPHVEGGKDSVRGFYEKIKRLGDDIAEKFFVTNGAWLLPDR